MPLTKSNGPVMILLTREAWRQITLVVRLSKTGQAMGVTRVKDFTRTRVRLPVTREIVKCLNLWH